jgi:ribokinase
VKLLKKPLALVLSLLMTLGSRGSQAFRVSGGETEKAQAAALRVQAVDTTGAGDTYTGFFVAGLMEDMLLKACMERASRAAAISVTRPGAAESVPWRKELEGEGLIL